MKTAHFWIQSLGLARHPEGGYFRETYRSDETIPGNALPTRFNGDRSFSTSIFYLLSGEDRSVLHRIQSDEIWHFHDGSPLSIHIIDNNGIHRVRRLGLNPASGQSPQVMVEAGAWFGAIVDKKGSYTLAGCTVAPGFDFSDFEKADKEYMLKKFPRHKDIIGILI